MAKKPRMVTISIWPELGGSRQVQAALVRGGLAVTPYQANFGTGRDEWVITQLRTGFSVGRPMTLEAAKKLVYRVARDPQCRRIKTLTVKQAARASGLRKRFYQHVEAVCK